MVDWKSFCAFVFVDDGEGRAVHVVLYAKGIADGFDEGGLAGSHLAVEGKDVALEIGLRDVADELLSHLVYFFKAADCEGLENFVLSLI